MFLSQLPLVRGKAWICLLTPEQVVGVGLSSVSSVCYPCLSVTPVSTFLWPVLWQITRTRDVYFILVSRADGA